MNRSNKLNAVFYAESYHPIQAGSIDGTDILPHDNAVYRALLCSSAGLYDPLADPKSTGDPYCTVFVARLSHLTTEHILHKAMSKYGRIKSLRIVRDIVTGASRGYAFVEYETEREMRCAYKDAHRTFIDDQEIIVDYNRQQLMPGWIPRRLGGGLGGRKESGQLRFGGRERAFRAPLRPIPFDDLKRLGIPAPPEGRYWSRNQVPSPPRRNRKSVDREGSSHKRKSKDSEDHSHGIGSAKREERYDEGRFTDQEQQESDKVRYSDREQRHHRRTSVDRSTHKNTEEEDSFQIRSPIEREDRYEPRRNDGSEERSSRNRHERSRSDTRSSRHESSHKRSSRHNKDEHSRKRHKDGRR